MKARAGARGERHLWALLGLCALVVLALSRFLTPAPEGLGTHRALGLPACPFWACFELPCPGCGLTTSFAWLARAELGRSLEAHPLGLPLFALTLCLVPVSLWGMWQPASLRAYLTRLRLDRGALLLALSFALVWLGRLFGLA